MTRPRRDVLSAPQHSGVEQRGSEQKAQIPALVAANDQYTEVKILKKHEPRSYEAEWGRGVLQVMDVRVKREYEDKKKRPRITEYPVSVGTRPDMGKRALYLVSHSDALLTTMRVDKTATSNYFWSSVEAGFPTVNVGVKRHPHRLRRWLPHTIPLHEMGDDSLAATLRVAEDEEIGQEADIDGLIPMGMSGYSRGFQLAFVKAARARLHNAKAKRIHGRAPGPRNKTGLPTVAGRLLAAIPHEGIAVGRQLLIDRQQAAHDYRNIITHDRDEIISYIGDAFALLKGDVSDAMHHIDRDIAGRGLVFKRDPFGIPHEYGVDFKEDSDDVAILRPFENFEYHEINGAHVSAMERRFINLDRADWQAAAAAELGIDHPPHIQAG